MGKINKLRVILGGLLAGVVLNICEFLVHNLILGKQWEEAMRALNLPPWCGCTIAWMILVMFLVGIFIVWLYAAIRPRFGPGPKTAVCAGVAVWIIYYLLGFGPTAIMGLFPSCIVLTGVILGLVESVLAALAGGWVYKEEE